MSPGQRERPGGSGQGDSVQMVAAAGSSSHTPPTGFVATLRERRRAWRDLQRLLDRDPYPSVEQYLDVDLREPAA